MPSKPKKSGRIRTAGIKKNTLRVRESNAPFTGLPMAAKRFEEIRKKKETEESADEKSADHQPTIGQEEVGFIPVEPSFLLVYAAAGDGRIMRISDINGAPPIISITGRKIMADFSHRESARWQEALDQLIVWGWVKQCDNSNEMYELTGTGYRKADMLKEGMGIDTTKEPLEEIKEFDT